MQYRPMCMYCDRIHRGRDAPPMSCEAFLSGIPDTILFELFDHRKPHPGDNGLRFRARTEADGALVARMYAKPIDIETYSDETPTQAVSKIDPNVER